MNDQQKKDTKALLATAGALALAVAARLVAKRFRTRRSVDAPAEDLYVAPKATAKPVYPTQRLGESLLTEWAEKKQERRDAEIAEQTMRDQADHDYRKRVDEIYRQQSENRRRQDELHRQQDELRRQQDDRNRR